MSDANLGDCTVGPSYLLIPVSDKPRSPLAVIHLDPKEAKSAVTLCIDLVAVKVESLRNCGLHLGHSSCRFHVYVGANTMTTMHDKGALVHTFLRCGDEVPVVRTPSPGCVDVGIRMENGK